MTYCQKCLGYLVSFIFAVSLFSVPCYANGNRQQQSTPETPPVKTSALAEAVNDNQRPQVTGVTQNNLVIIGVSSRFSDREESIKNALNDAARKLSFFYSVSGSSGSIQYIGAAALDVNFSSDYNLQYDNELDKYIELLDYNPDNDIFEYNNAFFITTRAAANVSVPAFRGYSISQTRPEWVEAPPSQIGGFTAGIGFSGRLYSHRDTVVMSYEKAVISIIENMGISVNGEHFLYQSADAFGFEAQSSGGSSSYGTLENFYVIETWTDPSSLSVWTLAVAGGKP